jgi:hypothetical protein
MKKILKNEIIPNGLSELLVGLGKSSELLGSKNNNLLLFSLGSSLKNFGTDFTSMGGALLRSTATFLDDLCIHYNLFDKHHLTKVSDAIYTGFLLAHPNQDGTVTFTNLTKTALCTGGLLLTSWLMGSADTITMERNIAKEAYNAANKIDQLTDEKSHLVKDLYISILLSSLNQTIRQSLGKYGFDFGAPLTITFNAITSLTIGKDSTEAFKKHLLEKLLEKGPLSNKIKFQEFISKNPEKLEDLLNKINSAKHLISFLPLKYQTATLGDHIAGSNKYGLLYKALNNLFNFYKVDNLSGILEKHQDKDLQNAAFAEALDNKNYDLIKDKLEHKLKASESNAFWDFNHKIINNLLPIAIQSTIAAYISKGVFFEDYTFLSAKHAGNQFLVNSNQIKNLFDEFLGHPASLEELSGLMAAIEDYNLNF